MTTLNQNRKKTIRFAMYLRCSSDDQADGDFTTIDTQRSFNQEYINKRIAELVAEGRKGVFVGEFVDEGKTGTNLKRGGWKQLRQLAEARGVDVVVITYMTRLGRGEAYTHAEWLLKEENVTVEMVKEKFSNDMAGRMLKRATLMADATYTDSVSDWTKSKQEKMVATGYHTGGCPAYGYITEPVPGMSAVVLSGGKVKPPPKRRVPDPETRHHALRAFEIMDETDNMGAVQRYLRSVCPQKSWSMETVRRMLVNVVYRGIQKFGEHVNPTAHEAIVPEDLWDRVQAKIAARAEKTDPTTESRALGYSIGPRVDDFPYYLRGRVLCGVCGGRMTPAGHHGHTQKVRYYECSCSRNRGSNCPVRRVNARTLHTIVLTEIERCAQHPTRLAGFIRETARLLPAAHELKDEIRKLRRNRGIAERNIRKCVGAIESASLRGSGLTALTDRISEQERHIVALDTQIAEMEREVSEADGRRPDADYIAGVWGNLMRYWEYGTEEERTEFLARIVEKVEFTAKNEGSLHLVMQTPVISAEFAIAPSRGWRNSRDLGAETASTSTANTHHTAPKIPRFTFDRDPVRPRTVVIPILLPSGNERRARTATSTRTPERTEVTPV